MADDIAHYIWIRPRSANPQNPTQTVEVSLSFPGSIYDKNGVADGVGWSVIQVMDSHFKFLSNLIKKYRDG